MSEAVELATAYIALVPSMAGAQGVITKQLVPAAEQAGDEAGEKAGGRFGKGLTAGMAAAGIAAGAALAVKGLYSIGETFDDVQDTIRVGTGATGDALNGLVDVATEVGKKVPAEYGSIAPVVADLNTRLGLSGDTLQTVASQYLEAGRILGQDVDIAKTTAAFSAFKIEGDDVAGAMDSLFRVSQATGVGMNELAAAAQANAPALQNLGFGFDETISLVGSLDKAGLNSTQTLAAMSKGLVTLAKDGEEPQEAFRRITGEIDTLVASGDTAGAIDLASGIFGTRAANQFVGAVQSGTLALDDLVGGVGATEDTILGVGAETQDFAEKWQLVKNQSMAALEPLGSAVFTALGDALTGLMPHLEDFGVWLGDNQWVLGVVAGVIGVGLVTAFALWTASIWASTAALLANPVTWIVVGIVALIAALVLLIANWDSVVAFLKDVWAGVVDWLAGVWDSITSGISSAWNAVASFFTGLWGSITSGITTAWNAIGTFFTNLWASIWGGVTSAWNGIVNWVKGVPDRFLAGLSAIGRLYIQFGLWVLSIKDAAVEKFLSLVDWVKGLPGRIVSALGNVGSLLLDAGKNIIDGFLRGLTRGFDAVKDFVGGIGSWIADHKGPKAYDLALLVPAGGWIMTGLRTGIENELPALRRTLSAVTGELAAGTDVTVNAQASARTATPTAAPTADGTLAGRTLVLRVGEREFTAYVDERASSVVDADHRSRATVRTTRGRTS